MKKHNFLIGLTLLIVSVILSNIFNENTITNSAIESFFYLPIAYNFVKAFYSKGNWLNLLLVSALICSIIIFTPKWGAWACIVINIVCCLFSYIILLLAIKIANNFNQKQNKTITAVQINKKHEKEFKFKGKNVDSIEYS